MAFQKYQSQSRVTTHKASCISEHGGCEAGAGPDQEQAHGGGGEQRGQEARPQRDGGAAVPRRHHGRPHVPPVRPRQALHRIQHPAHSLQVPT